MRQRCNNKNHPKYKNYGGRGIKVCESWYDFNNFFNDMKYPPSDIHSIDRINNNGNYEPSNCRWATPIEQANNRRNNNNVAYLGIILTLTEWARKLDIKANNLRYMLSHGYDLNKVIRRLDFLKSQLCFKFN